MKTIIISSLSREEVEFRELQLVKNYFQQNPVQITIFNWSDDLQKEIKSRLNCLQKQYGELRVIIKTNKEEADIIANMISDTFFIENNRFVNYKIAKRIRRGNLFL